MLFEVMEKRSELSKFTIICSQKEPNSWASMILNNKVFASSIIKRATKHYTVVIKSQRRTKDQIDSVLGNRLK